MTEYKTKITRDEYLKVLALAVMANEHYVKAGEFALAVNRIIMIVPEMYPGGHVDDAIYSSDRSTVEIFDEAIRKEGIKIPPK